MRDNVGYRKDVPSAKLPASLSQSAQDKSAVNCMQLAHNAGQKRRDEISAPGTHTLYGARHQGLHAADFHFDIQKCAARVTVEEIFQARRPFFSRGTTRLKLLKCMLANHQ